MWMRHVREGVHFVSHMLFIQLPCVDQPLDSRALVVSVLATPDAVRMTPSLVHTSPASWSNTLLHTTPTYILRTSLGRLDIHLPSAAGQFNGARLGRW